jgi:hypothetical protein
MPPTHPFIAFYRRCLGPAKKPALSDACYFLEHIDYFATHQVRYCGWSAQQAADLIAEAAALLEEHA